MSRGSFLVNRPSRMERRKTRGGFAARSEPSKAATTAKAASGSFSRPESFSVPGKVAMFVASKLKVVYAVTDDGLPSTSKLSN
ncbi:hypothetical protein NECAME_06009 [Necator americanus]|uniref:Uncharacterized protein n=1 Tax=Necator americanus TaxID=51031 RepID=W2TWW8_NECAM|nr:hypothetical protein NECAME_06009 [Necator americanus]ETN86303.1 hypothetical protein NECAME_06009 [Necator americanus]